MTTIQKKILEINTALESVILRMNIALIDCPTKTITELGAELVNRGCDTISNGGFWLWNYNSKEVFYSPKFCNVLGYDYGELVGFDGFQKANPKDMECSMEKISSLIEKHSTKPFSNFVHFTKKDGGIIAVKCSGVVYFKNNEPYIILGTHTVD